MSTTAPATAGLGDVIEPSQRQELTVWKFCAWSGPLFIGAFLGVWAGVAGWFPPPHEGWNAATTVQFFSDNSVRIGRGLSVFVSSLYLFWARERRP